MYNIIFLTFHPDRLAELDALDGRLEAVGSGWERLEAVGSGWETLDIASGNWAWSKSSENPVLKTIDRSCPIITCRASSAFFNKAECNC